MDRATLSERIYRRLLRLFPVDFRLAYRGEMEELFRLQRRGAAGSRRRLARLWLRAIADLARSAPREHWDALRQDVRFTLRTVRRNPGFAAVVTGTFALAVGANAAIFAVGHATLLRPLPFADEERLVRLVDIREMPDGRRYESSFSRRNFQAVLEQAKTIESAAAQVYQGVALRVGEGSERAVSIGVSGSWLRTLGLRPALGRGWGPEEEALGRDARVVLLSDRLWRRHLGADPGAVGRELVVDGEPHTVIGVMPRGLAYPYEAELWRLWDFPPEEDESHNLNVQARLAPGVSVSDARAELAVISRRMAERFPETNRHYTSSAVPTRENLLEGGERAVLMLLAAVGCVLLIAAANVLALLLARTVSRAPELAVRASLGASVWRRTRQLATENGLLALAGGGAGFLVARLLREPLAVLVPNHAAEFYDALPYGAPVLLFSLGLALAVGLVVGVLASWASRRTDLRGVLQGRAAAPGRQRVLDGLIVAETGVATALLVAALLLGLDLHRLATRDPGIVPEGLVAMGLSLPADPYALPGPRVRLFEEAVSEVEALPEVESAAVVNLFPYNDGNVGLALALPGEDPEDGGSRLASLRTVTPGYFDTLGIRLLQGRALTAADREGTTAVAVINRTLAERTWPGENPLGRTFTPLSGPVEGQEIRVVGVAGDVDDPRRHPVEAVYLPVAQVAEESASWDVLQPTLAVRAAAGAATAAVPAVRRRVQRIDPGVPVFDVRTAAEARAEALGSRSTGAAVVLAFGALGLLLAAVGTYGVVAYAVRRRMHELGMRMALGASRGRLVTGVLARGARLVGAGLVLGLAGAALLVPRLAGQLEAVDPADPAPYALVILLLAAAGLAACAGPARRATRADPAEVLREG